MRSDGARVAVRNRDTSRRLQGVTHARNRTANASGLLDRDGLASTVVTARPTASRTSTAAGRSKWSSAYEVGGGYDVYADW